MKKIIFIFSMLLLTSCTGVELKHLSPIPTSYNDGGLPGLFQDVLCGDWDRFKEKKETTNIENKEVRDINNN